MEDLRQICLYNSFYNHASKRNMWWEYIKNVHEQCYGNVNEDCSRLAHKDLSISYELTEQCVKSSFRLPNGETPALNAKTQDSLLINDLIDKELEYDDKYGP